MSIITADLCDEFGQDVYVCKQNFSSYGKRKAFAGPISTVKVLDDNVLVLESLKTIAKGNVLVVDGGGSRNRALLGDNLASIAVERELAGIIVYGCVRDTAELNEMNIAIRALGSNPMRSDKHGNGEKDIPVTFGEVTWTPDNYICADEDGILISDTNLLK